MFLGESTGALRYVLSSALPAHTAISVPLKTARYLGFTGGLALQDQTVCSWWEVMSALLSIVETSRGCPCRDSKSLITTLVSSLILFLSSAHRQGVELQMCTMHRDLSCKPLLMITYRGDKDVMVKARDKEAMGDLSTRLYLVCSTGSGAPACE